MDILINNAQCAELTQVVGVLGEHPQVKVNEIQLSGDLAEAIAQIITVTAEKGTATLSNGDRKVSVEEAGTILGLSQPTVIGMVKSKEIPATVIDGKYVIRVFDLQEPLAQIQDEREKAFEKLARTHDDS